ncbi:MAG TPA: exo-alpha-sialidase, partial [Bryobacterales bacterium]|nr:exo-alpha-sialidase [Bryobacterales bacterium]
MRSALLLLAVSLGCFAQTAGRPIYESELIFPLEHWHDHASSVVELPNGDLFACWYHGSGEKEADDVKIEAARLHRGQHTWTPRFTLADTPGFPDTNPALFLDSRHRLWLLWPVILANRWETALMKYRISSRYEQPDGPPAWDIEDNILFIPNNFSATVKATVDSWLAGAQLQPTARLDSWRRLLDRANDKYFARLGWMTRVHPLQLPSGRILVPLYSDGYSFSIIAITDDFGRTWSSSEPLVGEGNIQPTIVRRRDGTLVAYMRDNGPPPKRVHISSSRDDGVTWSPVHDTGIPNPGAGIEA